jgi:hypothetical protein
MAQMVEVVIISGPHKGKIISVAEDSIQQIPELDVPLLEAALDGLIAGINKLRADNTALLEVLFKREERRHGT